jgi:methylmalonyl-CoA mutase
MEARILRETGLAAVTRADWHRLAAKALGNDDPEAALSFRADDGFSTAALQDRRADPVRAWRARPGEPWRIVQRIDDRDPARANHQAREDIANGATGLAVVFEGAPNAFGYGLPATAGALARALGDIPLSEIALRIDVHPLSRASVDWLIEIVTRRHVDPRKLQVSFGIAPAALFGGAGWLRMSIEALQASMPQSLAHFFGLGLPGILLEADGSVVHNAGGTEGQELGFILASAVSHLRMFEEARQPLIHAIPHMGLVASVDQDQFVSIAKLRALRKLWARLLETCSVAPTPVSIHAETSYRMIAAKDAETNILRNTIATFAAAVGGADSISVLPHTIAHGLPDGFARRVARNTQTVLLDESHLDFVQDAAAGAGGIEDLTSALCEAGWQELRRIESEGGVLASLAAGGIQSRVEEARRKRAEALRDGARQIVGTTLHPLAVERPVSVLPADRVEVPPDGPASCRPLAAVRLDAIEDNAQ